MVTKRKTGRAGVDARTRYLRLHPLCLHCERRGITRAAEEVDHIIPLHAGGEDTEANKQSLCRQCHLLKTAADMNYRPKGCDLNGHPTDPRHSWNS